MMNILCFGDSITRGENDGERGGWVDRLKVYCISRFLNRKDHEECVFNLGIGSENTRMMRLRFIPELKARIAPTSRSIVTLAYGANDAAEKNGMFSIPVDEYVENLSWAIDEARGMGCEVWLLNITPVAAVADGIRNSSGRLRANTNVAQYNEALEHLAQTKQAGFIDVNREFRKYELSSLFVDDGVHPNWKGHTLIFNLVRDRILDS